MPVFAKEKYAARTGDEGSNANHHDEGWIACGYATSQEACAAVLAVAPTTFVTSDDVTLYRGKIRYEEVGEVGWDDDTSASVWDCTLSYDTRERVPSEEDTVRIDFDNTGGTAHITQALSSIVILPSDTIGDDEELAAGLANALIGDKGPDGVEGTDIDVSFVKLSVTKVFAKTNLPDPADLVALTPSVNGATITFTDSFTDLTIELAAGECKFKGARIGGARPDGLVEVNYTFEASANLTDFALSDTITIPLKKGWDYVWTRTLLHTGGTGALKNLINEIQYARVDKIYFDDFDWSLLKVGVLS